MHCPDRALKYLSFDIKLNVVAPIGAEIRLFDPFGSSRFGQSSSTRISKTGRSKKSKILGIFFFHQTLTLYQFSRKSETVMSGDCVDLTWNYPNITLVNIALSNLTLTDKE